MWPTAEVRWFVEGRIPGDFLAWFAKDFPLLETQPPRVDIYLPILTDDGMGIKLREGRIEIKQRYGRLGPMTLTHGVVGIPELWRKWAFGPVAPGENGLEGWVAVQKTRLVRNYAVGAEGERPVAIPHTRSPERGCSVELTEALANGQVWWTIGFEATGSEAELAVTLESVVEQTLIGCDRLWLALDRSYGYPHWLRNVLA